jgi:hypothetical protein
MVFAGSVMLVIRFRVCPVFALATRECFLGSLCHIFVWDALAMIRFLVLYLGGRTTCGTRHVAMAPLAGLMQQRALYGMMFVCMFQQRLYILRVINSVLWAMTILPF